MGGDFLFVVTHRGCLLATVSMEFTHFIIYHIHMYHLVPSWCTRRDARKHSRTLRSHIHLRALRQTTP